MAYCDISRPGRSFDRRNTVQQHRLTYLGLSPPKRGSDRSYSRRRRKHTRFMGNCPSGCAPALTLTSLASGTPIHGTELIIKDQFLLDKHDDLASLAKAYGDAVKNLKSTMDEFLTDPKNIPREPSYAAQSRVTYLAEVVQSLLTAASYEALSYLWRRSLVIIISGGVLAALGTSMFIWAANPPANVQASQANPVVLTSPDLGQVTLSEAGRRAVTEKIGTDCANKPVLNALVLGKTDAGPDVLLQEEGCETARLILVESWGSFNE